MSMTVVVISPIDAFVNFLCLTLLKTSILLRKKRCHLFIIFTFACTLEFAL